jgi:hypothetical protein
MNPDVPLLGIIFTIGTVATIVIGLFRQLP